jgi:hypothetical protein
VRGGAPAKGRARHAPEAQTLAAGKYDVFIARVEQFMV